jgi:hypothetical protein
MKLTRNKVALKNKGQRAKRRDIPPFLLPVIDLIGGSHVSAPTIK